MPTHRIISMKLRNGISWREFHTWKRRRLSRIKQEKEVSDVRSTGVCYQ